MIECDLILYIYIGSSKDHPEALVSVGHAGRCITAPFMPTVGLDFQFFSDDRLESDDELFNAMGEYCCGKIRSAHWNIETNRLIVELPSILVERGRSVVNDYEAIVKALGESGWAMETVEPRNLLERLRTSELPKPEKACV